MVNILRHAMTIVRFACGVSKILEPEINQLKSMWSMTMPSKFSSVLIQGEFLS